MDNKLTHDFKFDTPHHYQSIIKVIGVGGGGGNAVNHMFRRGIKGVDFVVMNTDAQALSDSPVPNKVQLGARLTEGLGAGTLAQKGKEAALETADEIKQILQDNTKMVFVTAGMGGGTGTGAAPEIARIAKELGILTVAIVTAPFHFEGRDKKEQAAKGIELLQETCDTVLVVLNDKLSEMYVDLDIDQAFEHADDILTNAAKSISEVITKSGTINVDFNDVKTVLKDAGQAVMGSAVAEGEDRAINVITDALHSPLLNNRDIKGAKRILMTVAFSSKCKMLIREQTIITDYILEKIGNEPNALKLGFIKDEELDQEMRITVIAAGFDLKGSNYNGTWIKIDGYDDVKEQIISSVGNNETDEDEEVDMADLNDTELAYKQIEINSAALIEKYLVDMPTEKELEDPTYLRNGISLLNVNKIPKDQIKQFPL
jgi:cell division protein FtsZ